MSRPDKMSPRQTRDLTSSLLHLAIYSVLLATYFFLVLRFFSGWLLGLFQQHRLEYALVAIALMIVQAVVLEGISYSILRFIRRQRN